MILFRYRDSFAVLLLLVGVSTCVHASNTTPSSQRNSTVDLDVEDTKQAVKCTVKTDDIYLPTTIQRMVKIEKATLIEYLFHFPNYTENPLLENMTKYYRSNKWARVTTEHGQTLLSLAFNYGILSMMTLRFGTTVMDIDLEDYPVGCLGLASEEEKIMIMRRLLARDFNPAGNISLVDDERVCHEVVVNESGYASFKDRCYYKDPLLGTLRPQDDVDSNFWLTLLYVCLVIIKFSLLLFGPSLFIDSVMSMSEDNVPYVVQLKDALYKTICIAQKDTDTSGIKYKTMVDLRRQKGYYKLKDSAAVMTPGQPTRVKFNQYDITVNYKRMLTENVVDVGLFDSIFRTICKCKIQSVGPFQQCCAANVLKGCPCCKKRYYPWIKLCRKLANAFLILLIPFPYYIRLMVFYYAEYDEVMARKNVIAKNGLKERYENSMMHYFTPTHPLFIVIYVIYGLTACMLAFMSRKEHKGRLLTIIIGAFRDLRYLNWTETLSLLVSNLVWPLKRYGLCGFLVGLIYWPIAVPLTIVVCLVYLLPTVYLTIRMMFYSKTAMLVRARRRKKGKPYQVKTSSDKDMHMFEADALFEKQEFLPKPSLENNNDDLGLDDVDTINPKEKFKNVKDTISLASSIIKYQSHNKKRFITYILCAILCIATLYAMVIIMAEVIGCLVEVFVFTIMGIIVNASAILKFVMLFIMILIYSADCFNNMSKKYIKLNKALFNEVKGRCKQIEEVTSRPAELQENTGFKSQELGQQAEYEQSDDIAKKPLNHWIINDLVIFVDSQDMPRIPRALFEEVCQIRVAGVPGPVFRGLIEAFESFCKAMIFILFVFVIVLTFGAVYKVSSTNQTLATMIGGFIPIILKSFLSPPSPDVELGTVSFKSKLDEVIKNFCQKWPIHDLPFHVLTKEEMEELDKPKDEKNKDEKKEGAPDDKKAEELEVGKDGKQKPQTSQVLDYVGAYTRTDGEGVTGVTELTNLTSHGSDLPAHKANDSKGKTVRIAETLEEGEVDLLIYMPEKFDEIWLDEWSDGASKASKLNLENV